MASAARPKVVLASFHRFSAWRLPASMAQAVRARHPDLEIAHFPDVAQAVDALADADVFVGSSLPPEAFEAAPQLAWIHSSATGVRQFLYPALVESPVVLTNARDAHSIPMAEHVIGMILALNRRFPAAMRHQAARHWGQQDLWDASPPRELEGATVLLVGLGAIGREVARRLRPFGVTLWAATRSGDGDGRLVDRVVPVRELLAALPHADHVVVAAPETPETRHLIGGAQLAAMRATATLVNVSRGSLVDEEALAAALSRGAIAAAALDVTDAEPLPGDSPLWGIENLLLTPHVSAVSERLWQRQADLFLENLDRFRASRPLRFSVDKRRGY